MISYLESISRYDISALSSSQRGNALSEAGRSTQGVDVTDPARQVTAANQAGEAQGKPTPKEAKSDEQAATRSSKEVRFSDDAELSDAERKEVQELKRRDQEVRRHEQAHASIGGSYTGSPQYKYQIGPDGRRYAVSGHVSVDTSPIPGDPQATAQKMERVRRAALAPAGPSGADRQIAARASRALVDARAEAERLRRAELDRVKQELGSEEEAGTGGATAEVNVRNSQSRSRFQLLNASEGYASAGVARMQSGGSLDVIACSNCGKAHQG